MNKDNARIISDDIFSSFKNIRGTTQYFNNMYFDVLAKTRQLGYKPSF